MGRCVSAKNLPWSPQQLIEPQLALQIIQEQFPLLNAQKIDHFGAGWDNTAFLVNEELVFRFPRREIALAFLEAEWHALPRMAQALPLPIPAPEWKGGPTTHFPWPFIGYRILPGTTACHATLSEHERAQLAAPLALFLSSLHAIPTNILASCSIPGDNRKRIDGIHLTGQVSQNIEQLITLGLLHDSTRWHYLIEHFQNFREPISSCIVHGDLYARHILINEHRQLAGVIDWGDIHIGDPAIDLAIAHSFLPLHAHDSFRQAYGEITDTTWSLAGLRALFSSSMITIFGHTIADTALRQEGLYSLHMMAKNYNL